MKAHAFQTEARSHEEVVAIDDVDGRIRSFEIESWDFWGSLLGWSLVVLLGADAACNILGIPLLSGLLLGVAARRWPDQLGWLTSLVWLLHAALTFTVCALLYKSPWRHWLPALSRLQARRDARVGDRRDWVDLYRTLYVVMVGVGALNLMLMILQATRLDSEQWALLALTCVAVLGLEPPLWTVARRLLQGVHNPTAIGLLVALAVILTGWFHLRPADLDVESHVRIVWTTRQFRTLQWCDLVFCVGVLSGFLWIMTDGGFTPPVRLRLQAPRGKGETVYAWDYRMLAVQPIVATLDPGVASRLVVFREDPTRGFVPVRRGAHLLLADSAHTVLDFAALDRQQLSAARPMGDQGGLLQGNFRFHIHSRTFESLGLTAGKNRTARGAADPDVDLDTDTDANEPGIDPRVFVAFVQRICHNEHLRLDLEAVLAQTLREYVGDALGTAQEHLERYQAMFREARWARMEETSFRLAREDMNHPDVGAPALTVIGVEPLRAALGHVRSQFELVHSRWQSVRSKLLPARDNLPRIFRDRLERWILEAADGFTDVSQLDLAQLRDLRILSACAGVSLVVESLAIAPGAATECERMAVTLEQREEAELREAEARIAEAEAAMLTSRQEHWALFSNRLVDSLPMLGRNPVFVEAFLRKFMGRTPEKLAELERETNVDARERLAQQMLAETGNEAAPSSFASPATPAPDPAHSPWTSPSPSSSRPGSAPPSAPAEDGEAF